MFVEPFKRLKTNTFEKGKLRFSYLHLFSFIIRALECLKREKYVLLFFLFAFVSIYHSRLIESNAYVNVRIARMVHSMGGGLGHGNVCMARRLSSVCQFVSLVEQ